MLTVLGGRHVTQRVVGSLLVVLAHPPPCGLADVVEAQEQMLVELALATGARKGKLLRLQWKDVDLVLRSVRFRDTKNGESRTEPLVSAAVGTLKIWQLERLTDGFVFLRCQDGCRRDGSS